MTTPRPNANDADAASDDGPLVMWWLAAIGGVAALVARALAPALRGVWIGADRAIDIVEACAGLMTQMFAVCAAAVAVGMISAVLRSGLAWGLKVTALLGGGIAVFAVIVASAARLHRLLVFVFGTAAVVVAFRLARHTARHRALRAGALIVGMMALAGMARLLAMVAIGVRSGQAGATVTSPELASTLVTVSATLSFGFEALAVGLAVIWLARSSSRPRALVLGMAAASVAGYGLVVVASTADASGVVILVSRLVQAMLGGPAPVVGYGARVVVEIAAWLVLFGVLSRGSGGRLVGGCIALSLVARAAPERPLCALALVVAALGLALDRHSPSQELSILELADDSAANAAT